jgi:hypothetical protein
MLNFSKFIFYACLLLPLVTQANECETLKATFIETGSYKEADIKELKKGVDADISCFKNLMGIMIYNGIYFTKDQDRAEDIFLDLSNKNYPEAQFNFALVLSKKLDQDPEIITGLLVGIYYKYANDRINSNLASNAKILGHKYTESLLDRVSTCSDTIRCSERIKSLTSAEVAQITNDFNNSIRDAQFTVASERLKLRNETKEQADTLIAVLSLGLMVSSLNASRYPSGSKSQSINGTEVWLDKSFGSRPMHLNTYQFPGSFW